jgi:predicted ATP-dependent serine protease
MAVEHARICGACGQESPSWASRCPVCGSLSLMHRITIVPAAPLAAIAGPKGSSRKQARRTAARMVGRDPARTTPTRSTA